MPIPISLPPETEQRVRESFAQQGLISTLNGKLTLLEPGRANIQMPFDERFTQQDGFLHAGVVTTLMDSACGYAAYTLMPENSRVLSVEFKVNFLYPAQGKFFRAEGQVIKPGKTLTICEGKLFASQNGQEKLVAVMQATMICVREKS